MQDLRHKIYHMGLILEKINKIKDNNNSLQNEEEKKRPKKENK